jgi:PHD/YefM family antitoxin component YafN of YafNO toxin-antitoxin module
MQTARISEYRSKLSWFHKSVLDDHEPLRVIGGTRGDVVVLPAADFENLRETIDILKDRATMNSLLENRADLASVPVQGQTIDEAFNDVLERTDK